MSFPWPTIRGCCLGVLLSGSMLSACADSFQAWYQGTLFVRLDERWSVGNYLDFRATDGVGELATTMVSPRIRYDLNTHWSAQLNTTWLEAQAPTSTRHTRFERLEFELNPRYPWGETLTFSARNRFEVRWIEDSPGTNQRLRVRPQVDLRTPWAGWIHGIFCNEEVFYDFEQGRITESRLVPFGIVMKPTAASELRVYHLWRRTRAGRDWFDFHALGLAVNLNF